MQAAVLTADAVRLFAPAFDSAFDPAFDPTFDPAFNSALDSALDSAFDPAFHPAYDPAFDSALVSESMIGDLVDLEGLVVVENESERHLLHINSIFINVNSGMECHHIVGDKQKWTR